MSGSRSAGGGGAPAPPSFGLLPRGDQQTLLRLMSDTNYQSSKLGDSFTPYEQRRNCRFWRLASVALNQPLPAVMLTGMYLRTEADAKWEAQQRPVQQQTDPERSQAGQQHEAAAPMQPTNPGAEEAPSTASALTGTVTASSTAAPPAVPPQGAVKAEPVPSHGVAQAQAQAEAVLTAAAALVEVPDVSPAGVVRLGAAVQVEEAVVPAATTPQPDAAAALTVEAGVPAAAVPAAGKAEEADAPAAAAALLQLAEAGVQSEAGQQSTLGKLPDDLLKEIFSRVPIRDRRRKLCFVNKRFWTLVRQLGLSGSCLCFDVTAEHKARTSKCLEQVGKLLKHAEPESQLSVLIKRLPSHQRLSTVQRLATDAQLRLVIREPKRDTRQRLALLTALPMLCKLTLVSTDWLPASLSRLTQLESLTWEGEGPFEDWTDEWGRALGELSRLTCLRWHPRQPPPGSPVWRWNWWHQDHATPAGLSEMTGLRTLVWLPPRSSKPLPNGAWLRSLRHVALTGHLAVLSVTQLRLSTRLETLCITDWEAEGSGRQILDLVQQLPCLTRFAYSGAPAPEEDAAALANAVAGLQASRPALRIEDSTAACLAELAGRT